MEAVCPFCRQPALIEERPEGLRCTLCLNTGEPQWAPEWAGAEPAEGAPVDSHDAWATPAGHEEQVPHDDPNAWPETYVGKSPWGAAIRSWILPGWGHGYVRGAGTGWGWFFMTVFAFIVAYNVDVRTWIPGGVVVLGWTLLQVQVAYSMAKSYNDEYNLSPPHRDGVVVAVVALLLIGVVVVGASVVFVLVSDMPEEAEGTGTDGLDAQSRLPHSPDVSPILASPDLCDAATARTWLQEYEAMTRFSATVKGTDDGGPVDMRIDYDEAQGYLYLVDAAVGESLHAFGPRVHITTVDGAVEYRDTGVPGYAVRTMSYTSQDPASEWFTTPMGALTPSCVTHGGTPAYMLSYTGPDTSEEWVWSSAGKFISARFQRAATGTDVTLTLDEDWEIVPAPAAATRGASVSYTVVSATSNEATLRIEDDFVVPYSEISIDLYDGETLIAELDQSNGWTTATGSARWQDQGQQGALDTGDTVTIRHPHGATFYFYDTWSASYFEEYPLEGEASLWQAPTSDGEMLARHYVWDFKGTTYTLDLQIPLSLLEFYESTDFTYRNGRHNFAAYVASQYDDEALQVIADELTRLGDSEGMSEFDRVSNALAFVQSLEYTSDSATTGFDEFPRYPIETLAELGGDCEDTAILFAALVQAMGFGAVLVEVPGHMAAGVRVDDQFRGTTYTYGGVRWAYVETTGEGYQIGHIPDAYRTAKAQIHSLTPQAVLVIEDARVTDAGGSTTVTVEFSNDGLAATASGDATVYGLDGTGAHYYDSDTCTFDRLEPGMTYTCDLVLRDDARIASYSVRIRTHDGLFAEREL